MKTLKMKKLSSLFILLATLMVSMMGCLKDKDFENQKYGIQINEVKAVAFPQAPSSPVIVGITGQADPLTVDGPPITIEGSGAAPGDINIGLEFSDAAVIDKGLTPLPAGSYSLNTMAPKIMKDSTYTRELKITVLNTDALDPNVKYGIGIIIKSVDQGYNIPANSGTVVIGFTIKNKYDGIYQLTGHHNRVPYTYPYDEKVYLITNGPNEVYFYWPEVKSIGHPIGTASGSSWYGPGIAPTIVFDLATNLVTDVYNLTPGTVITMFTGAGSRIGKFDPATRAITVDWNYNNNPDRAFFDDLTYIGPR